MTQPTNKPQLLIEAPQPLEVVKKEEQEQYVLPEMDEKKEQE